MLCFHQGTTWIRDGDEGASVAQPESLRQARTRRNLSLRELALLAGTSLATVWELETGRRTMPLPRTMRRIAGALALPETGIREFADVMAARVSRGSK